MAEKREKEASLDLPDEPASQRVENWIATGSGATSRETAKRGRPSKAESLRRERKNSTSSTISLASWLTKRVRESDADSSDEEKEGQQAAKKKRNGREKITTESANREMEQVNEMLQKIWDTMKQNKEEISEKIEKGRVDVIKQLKAELEKVKQEFEERDEERRQEIMELRREMAEMKREREEQERRVKKRNIIIWGAQVREGGPKQTALGVFEKIKSEYAEIKITEAWFIGKAERRGILAVLDSFEDKKKVMMGKIKLKGTTIFLDDDLTQKEREMQKNIRDWARILREKGKRVNVAYGKGYVNGKEFVWNNESGRMEEKAFREEYMQ